MLAEDSASCIGGAAEEFSHTGSDTGSNDETFCRRACVRRECVSIRHAQSVNTASHACVRPHWSLFFRREHAHGRAPLTERLWLRCRAYRLSRQKACGSLGQRRPLQLSVQPAPCIKKNIKRQEIEAAKGRLAGQVTCCNAGRPSRRETLHAVELPRQSDSELGSAHCAQHLLPLPMPESKWLSWPGGRPLAAIGATLPAPGAEIPEKPSNLSSLIKR